MKGYSFFNCKNFCGLILHSTAETKLSYFDLFLYYFAEPNVTKDNAIKYLNYIFFLNQEMPTKLPVNVFWRYSYDENYDEDIKFQICALSPAGHHPSTVSKFPKNIPFTTSDERLISLSKSLILK